jgi:hypothetical protein
MTTIPLSREVRKPQEYLEDGGIPVIDPDTGRTAGFVLRRGDLLIHFRRMEASRHFLRQPRQAIATSQGVLDALAAMHCTLLKVRDSESDTVYWAPLERILSLGFEVNRGYGRQIALPIALWGRQLPDGTDIPATLPKSPEATQPSLFAEVAS